MMSKPSKRSEVRVQARRLAAYRIWPELQTGSILNMPPRKQLWSLPYKQRWREALDRAAQLLEVVAEQMHAYSNERSDEWHCRDLGIVFHDNLQEVIELQADLDDLRSNF
jgi:hypothetical protein